MDQHTVTAAEPENIQLENRPVKPGKEAIWLRENLCPELDFDEENDLSLTDCLYEFHMYMKIGRKVAEENTYLCLEKEMMCMRSCCSGKRVKLNTESCVTISFPPADDLWDGYCSRRYNRNRHSAGAGLMAAWLVMASGLRLSDISAGKYPCVSKRDAILISSLIGYEYYLGARAPVNDAGENELPEDNEVYGVDQAGLLRMPRSAYSVKREHTKVPGLSIYDNPVLYFEALGLRLSELLNDKNIGYKRAEDGVLIFRSPQKAEKSVIIHSSLIETVGRAFEGFGLTLKKHGSNEVLCKLML